MADDIWCICHYIYFLVQIFWVRQAFTISESQFEQSVNGALRRVAENIAIDTKTDFQQNNPVIKINHSSIYRKYK